MLTGLLYVVGRLSTCALTAWLAALLVCHAASAQELPDTVPALAWTVDGGPVVAAEQVGDRLLLGGVRQMSVARVRDVIGPMGVFSADTAELLAADPTLAGSVVDVVIGDGVGGWFLAGQFPAEPHFRRLVHLDASGRQLPWTVEPAPFREIECMARNGNTLFIGGGFESVGGVARPLLAAIDIPSGTLLPFDFGLQGIAVTALHVSGTSLFIGGNFHWAGGQPRQNLARFDMTTGGLLPWTASIGQGYWQIDRIVSTESAIVIGGLFSTANGQPRNNLAVFDRATGALAPLAPDPDDGFGLAQVRDLDVAANVLYVGGDFATIGGESRYGAAAIDLSSGEVLPWAPMSAAANVRALAASENHVFLAGSKSDSRAFVTKVHAVSAAPSPDWQPRFGDIAYDITADGTRIAVGGAFSTHNAIEVPGFVAIDLSSGALIDTLRPNGFVGAMALSDSTLYLGGGFTTMNGQPRQSLAAIDTSTWTLLSFAPQVTGAVHDLEIAGSDLYVAGLHGAVNGQPRNSLAAIDRLTGEVRPFNPPTVYQLRSIPPAPATFTTLGVARGRVWAAGFRAFARFDAASGALETTDPLASPGAAVVQLGAAGDKIYVGTFFGNPSRGLARIDATTAAVDSWAVPDLQSRGSLAVRDGVVFSAGLAAGIDGIFAADAVTGALLPWVVRPPRDPADPA